MSMIGDAGLRELVAEATSPNSERRTGHFSDQLTSSAWLLIPFIRHVFEKARSTNARFRPRSRSIGACVWG